MFKLLLCVVFAVAAAEPDVLLTPGYAHTYLQPATTTITRHASTVTNTPYYSYPFGIEHFIKKRSADLYGNYLTGQYWDVPYSVPTVFRNTAFVHNPVLSTAHLIKKRSLLAPYIASPYTSYIAPGAISYSSVLHDTSLPYLSAYSTPHFIKKRSAVWAAPSTYLASSPLASTYWASSPLSYSSAIYPSTPYWSSYTAGIPFIKK
ncbi:unnamed protein product, partial [Iphiclides podalirius]